MGTKVDTSQSISIHTLLSLEPELSTELDNLQDTNETDLLPCSAKFVPTTINQFRDITHYAFECGPILNLIPLAFECEKEATYQPLREVYPLYFDYHTEM